jgi:hypothetical protein
MYIIRFNEEWDFHNELKIIAIENNPVPNNIIENGLLKLPVKNIFAN